MRVEKATAENEEELTRFFENFDIAGPIDYRVRRPAGLFAHYKLQSTDFESWILRGESNEIIGCASLVFRQARINGESHTIGYATDLRIAPQREAIIGWANHFLPITTQALESRGANLLFSVLSDYEPAIVNALVRPRAQRRSIPIYSLLRRFDAVTIVGHYPFSKGRLDTVRISRAQEKDIGQLADYLSRASFRRALSFDYTENLLRERFKNWPGFRPECFLLAKTRTDKIVGCVAPWSTNATQRQFSIQYNGFLSSTRQALKLGSWFGLSNRQPKPGDEMQTEYLTHFYADNPDVFEILLEHAYDVRPPHTNLVYVHFHSYPKTIPPKQFMATRANSALYTVTPRESELPVELLHSPLEYPPELELALV